MQSDILEKNFGFAEGSFTIKIFGSGLINHTWKVNHQGNDYIFQRVNDEVFKQPLDITNNIGLIGTYLKQYHPDYFFVALLKLLMAKNLQFI